MAELEQNWPLERAATVAGEIAQNNYADFENDGF